VEQYLDGVAAEAVEQALRGRAADTGAYVGQEGHGGRAARRGVREPGVGRELVAVVGRDHAAVEAEAGPDSHVVAVLDVDDDVVPGDQGEHQLQRIAVVPFPDASRHGADQFPRRWRDRRGSRAAVHGAS
jgi:hypothetical protein